MYRPITAYKARYSGKIYESALEAGQDDAVTNMVELLQSDIPDDVPVGFIRAIVLKAVDIRHALAPVLDYYDAQPKVETVADKVPFVDVRGR